MSVDVGASQTKSEPNVVPLCDILLVLLIIFMVITPVMQKGIDVKLPETANDTTAGPQLNNIVLTLEDDLAVKVNQEAVPMSMLESRLKDIFQTRSEKTIFIRADEKTPYKDVLKIIDMAKGAGIEVLGLTLERYKTSH